MKSKLGLILAGIFLLSALVIDIYSLTCREMFCSLDVWIFSLPWVFIQIDKIIDVYSYSSLIIIQILDLIIIYLIGLGISKIISRKKNFPSLENK